MIIVTGGAGFIGSALIWHLNNLSISNIVVVDDLGTGDKWKNLVKRKVRNIISISEFPTWLQSADKIEAIFHLGACSSTTEKDGDFLIKNNTHYSMTLFEYCARKSIPFIYASSAATYGSEEVNFTDDVNRIEHLRPINKYGYSKHLFDLWVLKQAKKPPVWAGLKFFNVYGPCENHKGGQASVALHAFPQIRDTKTLKLFKSHRPDIADGEQMRDFVYVKDVVSICEHFLSLDDENSSGIYNVGSGKARSFLDLMNAASKAFDNPKCDPNFIEMPENIRDQYQYFTEADLTKLRTQGRWEKPTTSLEEGVLDYYRNYLLKNDPYL